MVSQVSAHGLGQDVTASPSSLASSLLALGWLHVQAIWSQRPAAFERQEPIVLAGILDSGPVGSGEP